MVLRCWSPSLTMASCKMTGARIFPLAVMLSSVGQRAADQHSWAVCGAADCSVLRYILFCAFLTSVCLLNNQVGKFIIKATSNISINCVS